MANHVYLLRTTMAYPLLASAGYVAGCRKPIKMKTCVIYHDRCTVAVALGMARRHMSKKKPTHYLLLVNHAANASTLPTMGPAASGFPNV